MFSRLAALVDRLRRPEYTGDNRCVPCTVVNVALAFVASAAVGAASRVLTVRVSSRALVRQVVALGLTAVAFVASLLAISLRGYLVPGTPTLTTRYLPKRVFAAFERQRELAVDPEQFLLEFDAVEPCERAVDLCSLTTSRPGSSTNSSATAERPWTGRRSLTCVASIRKR